MAVAERQTTVSRHAVGDESKERTYLWYISVLRIYIGYYLL